MIIIIIIIIIIFFIFTNHLFPIKENLITWFLPFYNKSTKELTINTPPYITSNLIYNQLKFDYIKILYFFIYNPTSSNKNIIMNNYYNYLISNLIKTISIEKIFIKNIDKPEKVLDYISKKKDTIGLISAPLLIKLIQIKTEELKNINSIIIPNYKYIFFITTENAQISSLEELNNKKINIGPEYYDSNIFGTNMLENLEIINNIKINRYYYDDNIAIKKLVNQEIDGMIFTDLYPSNFLNNLIKNDISKTFILLPISNINKELFIKRHPFVNSVSIDLNALPENYLPVKIKDLEYTVYRPDLDTYRYPVIFICNKNTLPNISYQIVKGVIDNLELFNNSELTIKNRWNYLSLPDISQDIFIPTHIGAKIFYNQISVNTTNKSDYCKYYIGNKKCESEDIESAKIILG